MVNNIPLVMERSLYQLLGFSYQNVKPKETHTIKTCKAKNHMATLKVGSYMTVSNTRGRYLSTKYFTILRITGFCFRKSGLRQEGSLATWIK